jgi:hypothetical protein
LIICRSPSCTLGPSLKFQQEEARGDGTHRGSIRSGQQGRAERR